MSCAPVGPGPPSAATGGATSVAQGKQHLGSYGLRLDAAGEAGVSLDGAARWLPPADVSWPQWRIEVVHGDGAGPLPLRHDEMSSDHAALVAEAVGGWIEIHRRTQLTRFHVRQPINPAALVHPLLTSTAAIAAHWLGRTPFHAGGFALGGRVWGVLGAREMGKSSLLMALHEHGVPIVADDLIVLREDSVYSGPRCLDLRRTAAEHFEAGEALGRIGHRDRWRVNLPPIAGELPLTGWVVLAWAQDFRVESVAAAGRLGALAANRAVVARGEVPRGLFDAATCPMVVFGRPRDWSKLADGVDRLLAALSSS